MLRIGCPYCGERDQIEFAFGDDATCRFPDLADCDIDAWTNAVFFRDNPKGIHREYWQHQHGCRQWLLVVRDTVTHEIQSVTPAREVLLATRSGQAEAA
jgi:sarcosine oxidase subunit delta